MTEDPFEEWDRYPADKAHERSELNRLAWFAAPWGDAGISVMVLALTVGLLRRLGRQVIRLASRLRLV